MTTFKIFSPKPTSKYDAFTLVHAGSIIDELRDLGEVFEAKIGNDYVLVDADDITFEER